MESTPNNRFRVGILDSGIGGLTIREKIMELLPDVSTFYIADHAAMPYGEKTDTEIISRVLSIIGKFLAMDVDCIVVACNTASVVGISTYREVFPDIPIIGVVPVVKTAAQQTKTQHYALFSTTRTIESPYTDELIAKFSPECTVDKIGSPTLARLIEDGYYKTSEGQKEVMRMVSLVGDACDVAVLGCTHYPLIQHEFRKFLGQNRKILDSSGAVARHVGRILVSMKPKTTLPLVHTISTTGNPEKVSEVIKTYIPGQHIVESINIP